MYLSKKEAWRGLIYTLLYPALLGSMLYDIFSPTSGRSLEYIAEMILVCIYLVDYLYLYNDWMSQGYPNSWREIFSDGVIAVLYRLAFGFTASQHPTRASICLVLVFSLYFFYEIARHPATRKFISATVFVLTLNLPLWLLTTNLTVKTVFFASTALMTLSLLSVYVFYYGPTYVTPEGPA